MSLRPAAPPAAPSPRRRPRRAGLRDPGSRERSSAGGRTTASGGFQTDLASSVPSSRTVCAPSNRIVAVFGTRTRVVTARVRQAEQGQVRPRLAAPLVPGARRSWASSAAARSPSSCCVSRRGVLRRAAASGPPSDRISGVAAHRQRVGGPGGPAPRRRTNPARPSTSSQSVPVSHGPGPHDEVSSRCGRVRRALCPEALRVRRRSPSAASPGQTSVPRAQVGGDPALSARAGRRGTRPTAAASPSTARAGSSARVGGGRGAGGAPGQVRSVGAGGPRTRAASTRRRAAARRASARAPHPAAREGELVHARAAPSWAGVTSAVPRPSGRCAAGQPGMPGMSRLWTLTTPSARAGRRVDHRAGRQRGEPGVPGAVEGEQGGTRLEAVPPFA